MKKRLLSWLLALCMMLPAAFAEDITDIESFEPAEEEITETLPDSNAMPEAGTSVSESYEAPEITDAAIPEAEPADETSESAEAPEITIEDAIPETEAAPLSNIEILMAHTGLSADAICAVLGKCAEEINAMPADKLDYAEGLLGDSVNPSSNGEVIKSGTCGDNLTWVLTDDDVLTISGTGAMEDYSDYNAPWSQNWVTRESIASISISNGVTNIGNYAFNGCIGLKSVSIPESITSIGSYAFNGCTELKSISIPQNVTSIGSYAFYKCSRLIKPVPRK